MIVGIALLILSVVDTLTIWRIKELEARIEELQDKNKELYEKRFIND